MCAKVNHTFLINCDSSTISNITKVMSIKYYINDLVLGIKHAHVGNTITIVRLMIIL